MNTLSTNIASISSLSTNVFRTTLGQISSLTANESHISTLSTYSLSVYGPTTLTVDGSSYFNSNIVSYDKLSVEANKNLWVAVGDGTGNETIRYSTDGLTWSQAASGGFITGGLGVAWNGSLWVAAGFGTGATTIQYSTNGSNWTSASTAGFSSGGTGVAWNGSMWVAVGKGSTTTTIEYSYNGSNWSNVTNGFSSGGTGVAWNGSMWVAVGSDFTTGIKYSYNGSNWSNATGGFTAGNGVAWNGSMWVAVGSGSGTTTIKYSMNGINWSNITSGGFSSTGRGVAWNGSMWIAVGAGSGTTTIQYSLDGLNWSNVSSGGFTTNGYGITWNGSMWIATGDGSTTTSIQYSMDGLNWLPITSGGFAAGGRGVAYTTKLIPDIRGPGLDFYLQRQPNYISTTNQIFGSVSSIVLNNTLYVHRSTPTVGINTTNPQFTLDVNGNVHIDPETTSLGGNLLLGKLDPSLNGGYLRVFPFLGSTFVQAGVNSNSGSAGQMFFGRIRGGIDNLTMAMNMSTQNVGIRTASPQYALDVDGQAWARSTLYVGSSLSNNQIRFYGTSNDRGFSATSSFITTVIGERVYNEVEQSELLLFKGNDYTNASGPDNIRVLASGNFVVDVGSSNYPPSNFYWYEGGNPPNAQFQNALVVQGLTGNVGINGVEDPPTRLVVKNPDTSALTGIAVQSGDVYTIIGNYGGGCNVGSIQTTSGGTDATIGSTPYSLILQPLGGIAEAGGGEFRITKTGSGVTSVLRIAAGLDGSATSGNISKIDFITRGGGGGNVSNTIQQSFFGAPTNMYGIGILSNTTNLMTILNTGLVGIGTSNPQHALDVKGNVRINGEQILLSNTNSVGNLIFTVQNGITYIQSGANLVSGSGNKIYFTSIYDTKKPLIVDTVNNRVGIADITDPQYTLDVGGQAWVRNTLLIGGQAATNEIRFYGTNADNPGSFRNAVISERVYTGDEKSELVIFKGNNVEDSFGPDNVRVLTCGNFVVDVGGSNGSFEGFTWPIGGNPPPSQFSNALVVRGLNGYVGLGLSNPTYQLQLSTDFAAKSSSTTWATTSDRRIKTEIESANLDICYDNIHKLQLRRFTYISSFISSTNLYDKRRLGVIAQEVSTIIPKLVETHPGYGFDDLQYVNMDQMNYTHFGATQKLMEIVETQSTSISSLTGTVEEQSTIITLQSESNVSTISNLYGILETQSTTISMQNDSNAFTISTLTGNYFTTTNDLTQLVQAQSTTIATLLETNNQIQQQYTSMLSTIEGMQIH